MQAKTGRFTGVTMAVGINKVTTDGIKSKSLTSAPRKSIRRAARPRSAAAPSIAIDGTS
jgi:hypothetical protein